MGIVVFDSAKFKTRYPEFAAKDDTFLAACFEEACIYLDNTSSSIVGDLSTRAMLLNMLVAHIVALQARDANNVGRVQSASQGSVSASFAVNAPGSSDWFMQTQYGASYWRAIQPYASMLYIPTFED